MSPILRLVCLSQRQPALQSLAQYTLACTSNLGLGFLLALARPRRPSRNETIFFIWLLLRETNALQLPDLTDDIALEAKVLKLLHDAVELHFSVLNNFDHCVLVKVIHDFHAVGEREI
jgi:hypothetical protein